MNYTRVSADCCSGAIFRLEANVLNSNFLSIEMLMLVGLAC